MAGDGVKAPGLSLLQFRDFVAAPVVVPVLTSAAGVGNPGLRVQLFLSVNTLSFLAFEATISPCKDLAAAATCYIPSANKGMRTRSGAGLLNHM